MGITQVALIDFIRDNPDATSADVAKQFDSSVKYAATRLKQMADAKRIYVSSTNKTLTNRPVHHYRVVDAPPEAQKPERAEAAAKVKRILTPRSTLVEPSMPLALDLTDTVSTLTRALVDGLVSRVVAEVQSELAVKLAASLSNIKLPALPAPKIVPAKANEYDDAAVVAAVAAPAVVRDRKPKIGVVGLLPQQQAMIKNEFGKDVDLRFWKDESNSMLKSIGATCEIVFVTKWAGHSECETLRSVGAKYKFLPSGGLDQLRDAITDVYLDEAV